MAKQVNIVWECDECHENIVDESERISLRIERTDTSCAPLEIDLHERCVNTTYLPDEIVRTKRSRRPRGQMQSVESA